MQYFVSHRSFLCLPPEVPLTCRGRSFYSLKRPMTSENRTSLLDFCLTLALTR